MTFTIPPEWTEAFARDPVNHRHIVTINVGRRGYFTVVDYTLASGVELDVNVGVVPNSVTEGTHFDAETSNNQTAANIAEAITRYILNANAWAQGPVVVVVIAGGTALSLASDDATAVTATPAVDTTDSISYVTGDAVLFDYSPSIASVRPAAEEIEAVKRVYTAGKKIVTWGDDGAVRRVFSQYGDLKGKIIEVKLGSADIAENKFINDGKYVLDENEPMKGRIVWQLADVGAILEDQKITMNVVSLHPLEVILTILEAAGVPSALYDATTLDPTSFSDIGHWCVSRHPWWHEEGLDPGNAVTKPTNASDLVNELLELLDGSFVPDEDGIYEFTRYDPAGSSVATWDVDNARDFAQPETWKSLKNHIAVSGAPRGGKKTTLWEAGDIGSMARYATAGGEMFIKTEEFDSEWLNAISKLWLGSSLAVGGATLKVQRAVTHGFSGCKYPAIPSSAAQDSNTDCAVARPVWLMIFCEAGDYEIVKCTAIAPDTGKAPELIETPHSIFQGHSRADNIIDNWEGQRFPREASRYTLSGQRYWLVCDFTISDRGQFGTTERLWDSQAFDLLQIPYVADVTIAKDVCERKLDRLAHGITPVEIQTDFRQMAVQLAELVAVDHALYLDHNKDGSSGQTSIFEVLRKEPRPHAARPGINWKLRLARHTDAALETIRVIYTVTPIIYPSVTVSETNYVVDNDGNFVIDNDGNYCTVTSV